VGLLRDATGEWRLVGAYFVVLAICAAVAAWNACRSILLQQNGAEVEPACLLNQEEIRGIRGISKVTIRLTGA
jgi:hypothetical protein